MVNLFQTIDSLQMSVDPYLTLEEKLGGMVSNNEESRSKRSGLNLQSEYSSSEELDGLESDEEEYEGEEAGADEQDNSNSTPLESEEKLVSQDEESSEEEMKEGGEESKSNEDSTPADSSVEEPVSEESSVENLGPEGSSEEILTNKESFEDDSTPVKSSNYEGSSSYVTAREIAFEENQSINSSTTYRNFSDSFNEGLNSDRSETPSLNKSRGNLKMEKVTSKARVSKERLDQESVLASKVRNPKTYIGDMSSKKGSPQKEHSPMNVAMKIMETFSRIKKEQGKIEVKALLCFRSLKITISEQYSTEYERVNRNRHQKEKKRKLEKIDFLELILEELTVNYEQGKMTDVKVSINRLFAQDIQMKKSGEKLIPHPYDRVI